MLSVGVMQSSCVTAFARNGEIVYLSRLVIKPDFI